MKKTTRIIAALILVVMLCVSLASCSKPSGEYEADIAGVAKVTLNFDGDDVQMAFVIAGETVASLDATFEVEDDKITFDIANEDEIDNYIVKQFIRALESPNDFVKEKDYIKIDGQVYTKVEE